MSKSDVNDGLAREGYSGGDKISDTSDIQYYVIRLIVLSSSKRETVTFYINFCYGFSSSEPRLCAKAP